MRKYKRSIFVCLFFIIAAVMTAAFFSAQKCAAELSVVRYELRSGKIRESIRIVQLSDLHGYVFGEGNEDLVSLVAEQQPDLIAMTGDMLDKQDENADVVCALIRELQSVAPVYYCHGNHEMTWIADTGTDLNTELKKAGAEVLDVSYLDILVNGQEIRLAGYHGYYRQPGMFPVTQEQRESELAFADAFENTNRFKLLLNHIPTAWLDWGYIDKYPVDLVLTGHYHGGQIRLPLIGGIYAPYVGLFPDFTEGMYPGELATCILSTGLGSSPGIPRVNNLPQVVVVDLLAEP